MWFTPKIALKTESLDILERIFCVRDFWFNERIVLSRFCIHNSKTNHERKKKCNQRRQLVHRQNKIIDEIKKCKTNKHTYTNWSKCWKMEKCVFLFLLHIWMHAMFIHELNNARHFQVCPKFQHIFPFYHFTTQQCRLGWYFDVFVLTSVIRLSFIIQIWFRFSICSHFFVPSVCFILCFFGLLFLFHSWKLFIRVECFVGCCYVGANNIFFLSQRNIEIECEW